MRILVIISCAICVSIGLFSESQTCLAQYDNSPSQIAPLNPLRPLPTPINNQANATNGQAVAQPQATAPKPASTQPPAKATGQPAAPKATPKPAVEAPEKVKPASATMTASDLTAAIVTGRLAEIEADAALPEEEKKPIVQHLQDALKWLQLADDFQKKADQYKAHAELVPNLIVQAREKLEAPLPAATPEFPADAMIAALEQSLRTAEQEAEAAQTAAAEQEATLKSNAQNKRKEVVGKRRGEVETQLEELKSQAQAAKADEGDASVAIEIRARIKSLEAELAALQAERDDIDKSADLNPILRDLAQRKHTRLAKIAEAWREHVAHRRKEESQRQVREARRAAEQAHPALKESAKRNAELAETRTQLASLLDQTAAKLKSLEAEAGALAADFENVQKKVEAAGMTPAIGLLLRNRRDHLPKPGKHLAAIDSASHEMQTSQFTLLELETERSEMGDLDAVTETVLEEIGPTWSQTPLEELRPMVRTVFENRRDFLDQLIVEYTAYHDDLSDLELMSREHVALISEYAKFIDQRVLWIRSSDALSVSDLSESVQAIQPFITLSQWQEVGSFIVQSIRDRLFASIAALLLLVVGGFFHWRVRKARFDRSQTPDARRFFPTVVSVAETLFLALWRPLILGAVGWWLASTRVSGSIAADLGVGIQALAWVLGGGMLGREILRRKGLAILHFKWEASVASSLRQVLGWLMLIGLPLVFIVTVFETHQEGAFRESLGRLAFVVGMILVALPLHFVMRPGGGVIAGLLDRLKSRWPYQLRHVWYFLAVVAPFALGSLAVMGYSYSAHQLLVCIHTTAIAAGGIYLAYALVRRAFAVRCAQLQAAQKVADADEGETQIQRRATLLDAREQIDQLMRWTAIAGVALSCWLIWATIVPAFNAIGNYEVWPSTVTVAETVVDANGNANVEERQVKTSVVLFDVLLAVCIFSGAWIAIVRLQGLLELTVLDRLPLDRGGRHAVVVLARYGCAIVAAVMCANLLNISWSSVQWLIAAMTVGLGFGLQEIFANFVSGLIILFERPIRIGDLVTVGGVTGKVTRMAIRATIITDYDQRELIVPNKKFITDEVVNWTLSSSVTRFILPVGISYSCDPSLAREILERIAGEHRLVLKEPKPVAIFKGFGDSTLDLELRAFLASRDEYPIVMHELNVAVEAEFRKADLEIAFPQQDLHIRTVTPEAGALLTGQSVANASVDAKPSDDERHAA